MWTEFFVRGCGFLDCLYICVHTRLGAKFVDLSLSKELESEEMDRYHNGVALYNGGSAPYQHHAVVNIYPECDPIHNLTYLITLE
jgi:hypothetical protein